MLSPIADRGLQTGNGTPNFGIAGTNGQFSPHRKNVVPNCRSWSPNGKRHARFRDCWHKRPIQSPPDQCCPQLAILVSKPQMAHPIWDLLPQTADLVDKVMIVSANPDLL